MSLAESDLLQSDLDRAGIPQDLPLRLWAVKGGSRIAADINEAAPGLLKKTRSQAAADILLMCGTEALAMTELGLGEVLGAATQASVCVVDIATGAPFAMAKLAGTVNVAKTHGFDVLNIRAIGDSGDQAMASTKQRVTFVRGPGASAADVVRRAFLLDALGLGAASRSLLAASPQVATPKLLDGAYFRQGRVDGWGPVHPSNRFASAAGVNAPRSPWNRDEFPVLISIHLQTNQPENIVRFFDRIANSCDDPSRIEVIVKIDDDHVALNEILPREVAQQPFRLKYISTPLIGGFFALWESMNDMLAITDPGAYFLLNLNDEMYFADRGWDTRIERYVGAFPDHLFRLRTSVYRFRNYHDHWECGFAPETSAITTKKWIETGGNWNPCLGPDTFQQCVAYYFNLLNRKAPAPRPREIPIDDIRFGGEGAYIGLTGKALRRRVRGATRAWYRLMSPEIQQDAARRAAKLHAMIEANSHGLDATSLRIDDRRRAVNVVDNEARQIASFSFAIPRHWYTRINARRALQFSAYGGGGEQARRGHISAAAIFMAYRYDFAERIREWIFEQPEPLGADGAPVSLRARAERVPYIIGRQIYYLIHIRDYADLFARRYGRRALNVVLAVWARTLHGIHWRSVLFMRRVVAVIRRIFGLGYRLLRKFSILRRPVSWILHPVRTLERAKTRFDRQIGWFLHPRRTLERGRIRYDRQIGWVTHPIRTVKRALARLRNAVE